MSDLPLSVVALNGVISTLSPEEFSKVAIKNPTGLMKMIRDALNAIEDHPTILLSAPEARKYYVVWNSDRSEGFITDDILDAEQVSTGNFGAVCSTAGIAFHEAYYAIEDSLSLQEINL